MTTPSWGYERNDCAGDFALSLFLDDIDTLITHYTALARGVQPNGQGSVSQTPPQAEVTLFQAQAAANKLLQAYQNNARRTTAFAHQHIEIKSTLDASGELILVPIFSSGLKQHLIRLLNLSNQTPLH